VIRSRRVGVKSSLTDFCNGGSSHESSLWCGSVSAEFDGKSLLALLPPGKASDMVDRGIAEGRYELLLNQGLA
jgi:hypothetical protein